MKKKFIRLVLSKEDTDLIAWKNSLPPRSFTETVSRILVSESDGQIAPILYEFSSSEVAEDVRAGFYIGDQNVLALLNGIKKGDRTDAIKKILRKHIAHNREHPPELVSVELLHNILVDFRTKMADREAACAGTENKYRKLCDSYYDGMVTLFNTVLAAAYNSGDENDCDRGLRRLNVNQIINQAFEGNFGPQSVSGEDV
ncbi:MAG: hypothetical protein IJE62_05790 [Clostridia bacterium]|nr:hypothetical protein [Clostridia bacterium]